MPAVSPNVSNPVSAVALDASNNNINAMLSGYKWGGIVGTPVTVYFSFPTSGNAAFWSQDPDQYGYDFDETETLVAFSAVQQAAATSALQQWANVANITFQKVTETTSAVGDIRFGNTFTGAMEPGDYAYAWGLREISPGVASPDSGDIWLNRTQPVATGNNYAAGAAGYHTILHEIGHALGIDHSFAEITPENPADLGVQAGLDFYQYSVMSYDSFDTGSAGSSDHGYNEYYPTTLMLLDIQAIQHLYGANMTYRTGNDTYVFNSATKYLQTIWDAGGTDTIQYSSAIGGLINLNEGAFSQLGKSYKVGQEPGFFAGFTQISTVGIAFGALIENAIGGSGNDRLIGNSTNNVLDGGAGIDTLEGGAGDDVYLIDNVGDIVNETGSDTNDTLKSSITLNLSTQVGRYVGIENFALAGVAAINLTGDSNNNLLNGNDGANIIDGNGGEDAMNGGKGADTYIVNSSGDTVTETFTLALGGGNDLVKSSSDFTLATNIENLTLTDNISLNGGTANINGTGNEHANIIIGNAGANTLFGADGNDTLTANAGDDSLNGDNGNDTLNGGEGNDTLTGGAGVDALTGGKGNDTYRIDLIRTSALATSTIALQDAVSELANIVSTNPATNMVEGIDTIVLTNNTGNAGAPIDTSTITTVTTLTVNANVENFDASQTGNIKLNITGNALANIITGNGANNVLDGGLNDGKIDTLNGGAGDDTYIVDMVVQVPSVLGQPPTFSFTDIISDSNGIDILKLRGAINYGATYIETLRVNDSRFFGLEGIDLSVTGATRFNLEGNSADNILIGNAFANTIDGSLGNDTLDGGTGADSLLGGDGDDTYVIDNIADIVNEAGTGNDTIRSSIAINLNTRVVPTNLSSPLKYANIEHVTLTGAAAVNITGDAVANILNGNDGANIIDGDGDVLIAGADTMDGGKGNDTYIVDSINDEVSELFTQAQGGGIDLVQASVSFELDSNIENLTLTDGTANGGIANNNGTGNELANIIIGNAGANRLRGEAGVDTLVGGLGDDYYIVNLKQIGLNAAAYLVLEDIVTEQNVITAGVDTIELVGIFNTVTKASTIKMGLGIEVLDARQTDTTMINITGNELNNTIYSSNIANNIHYGGLGDDVIRDYQGDDYLYGEQGNDDLGAGDGNDTLDGGVGSDRMNGDGGNDTYIIDNIGDFAGEEENDDPNDTVIYKINSHATQISIINVGVNNQNNIYLATPINGVISASLNLTDIESLAVTGTGRYHLVGDTKSNTLIGNAAINIIDGGAGNDTLDGGAGNDSLIGGAGNDTYAIDTLLDVIDEGSNTDTGDKVQSANLSLDLNNAKFLNVIENAGLLGTTALNLTGNAGNNELTGNAGANILDGKDGADTMDGGKGNDTYIVGAGDVVEEEHAQLEGGGIDLVKANVSFELTTNIENLTLTDGTVTTGTGNFSGTGNSLNNVIIGNAGGNELFGEGGNDTLTGNAGDDILNGGNGNDLLNGGAGLDTFVFDFALNALTNKDTIQGFNVLEDRIQLDAAIFSAISTTLDANEFRSGAGFTVATTLDQRIIFNSINGALYYDADGLGGVAATQFATLTGTVGSLSHNDFFLTSSSVDFTLVGTDQADILNGGNGYNAINGLAGDDTINGGIGADIMFGDVGNDVFYVDNIDDIVLEDYFYYNEATDYYYENGYYNFGYDGQHPNNTNSIYSSVTYTADFGISNLTLTGTANINAYGNNYKSNIINGNSGNNILDGGLNTNPELDSIANSGTHIFFGNHDTLIGGAGNDTYIIRNGETVIELAGEGIDTYILSSEGGSFPVAFLLEPGSEIENFILANDNVLIDYMSGTNKDNLIVGNGLANNLYGLFGNDELKGLGGNDRLYGMAGNDILWGGAGNDTFVFESAGVSTSDIVEDFVSGQDKIRVSDGTFFMPALLSGIYTDMFVLGTTSQDANDYFIYNKAAGDLYFDDDGSGVNTKQLIANFLPNTVLLQSDFLSALNTTQPPVIPVVIDQLITGSAFNDSLASGAGNDTINAGAGNDTLNGGDGNDKLNGETDNDTFYGMGGNDTLNGGDGNNTLFGGDGNDLLFVANSIFTSNGDNYFDGGSGSDTMSGGQGSDVYVVDNIGDIVGENSGYVTGSMNFVYSSVTYTTRANIDLVLTGTGDINAFVASNFSPDTNYQGYVSVTGNSGNNYLEGALNYVSTTSRTYDLLKGGAGNDTYIVDSDVIVELSNEGIDTAIFANFNGGSTFSGTYTIEENIENVDFSQYLNNKHIFGTGNSLDNIITGSRNVDALNGMAGNDTLIGGEHGDLLTGGIGSDVFKFNAISEFQDINNLSARDVITDFSRIELDRIDFATIDANSNVVGNQIFTFIGNNVMFSNVAGQLKFDTATNSVYGDINGDSAADFQIALTGVTSLVTGDFILQF